MKQVGWATFDGRSITNGRLSRENKFRGNLAALARSPLPFASQTPFGRTTLPPVVTTGFIRDRRSDLPSFLATPP
jgi:hypothetical protein